MAQKISVQKKSTFMSNEEDNWDDIEFPETGLLLVNNNNDYELSTTTRDMSEITIHDSSDDDSEEEEDYFGYSNKSTPVSSSSPSSSSSINKVKEMMINSGVVITNNNKEDFSGLMITRIGGENNKVIAVGDDWDNDIEIPEDGLANLNLTINTTNRKNRSRSSTITATNDFEFDSWDEEEQNTTAKDSITSPRELIIKRIKDPSKVLSKSSTTQSKALESFDADFDFSDVDLNKLDLSAKALKLHQGSDEGNLNDKDPFGSERHSSRNSSRLSILPSPAPTNGSQSAFESEEEEDDLFDDIQFPERMDSLTLISYNDDNDFENGLDIVNEGVFDLDQLKNKNIITRPNPAQQKRARRESFSIEFNTSPKNSSRSSTPSISPTNSKAHQKTTSINNISSLKTNKASLTSSRTPTPTPTTAVKSTSKSTFAKSPISRSKSPQCPKSPKPPIRRLVNNSPEKSKNTSSVIKSTGKPPKITATSNSTLVSSNKCTKSNSKINPASSNNKKRYQQNINIHNNTSNAPNSNFNSNSLLEIMRKPKRQQSFGDGTELDGFDDLPISIDRERSCTTSNCTRQDRKNSISSVGSRTDNSGNLQRHRKNKKNRKRKKPQLIRNLNADKNLKVVGEMVYNPITQRWDGNDSVLKDFDNSLTSPTRPALILNMNNRTTNTKSFQVVGKMKFDPIKMCWNNSSDDDEILARFDYDDDRNGFISPLQASDDTSSDDIKRNKRNKPISLRRQSKHQQLKNINPAGDDSNDFQVGSEFDITPGFLAALLASERQHRNEITRWYPDALSKKNDSRFGLRDITLQRSYLYDLRNNNNNRRNASNSSSGNNSKIYQNNRSGGLFEAAKNLTRHERRHFR